MSGYGRAMGHASTDHVHEPYRRRATHRHDEVAASSALADRRTWSSTERDNPDLDGVTILLVEDDPLSREALEMIFMYYGARVIGVASAAEALASYEQSLPTIVVSDIGLPEEDGCALLRAIRIREFGRGRHTPAVAISAFPVRETSERAHGAGFDSFLPKPLEVPALLRVVHRLSTTIS